MLAQPPLNVVAVPPDMVRAVWPIVSTLLDRCYAKNDQHLPPNLIDDLRAEHGVLWVGADQEEKIIVAMITTVFDMRSGSRMCRMKQCGGEFRGHGAFLRSVIERYAKSEGCDRVSFEGSLAWQRLCPDYKPIGVIFEKRI